jgi:death-on-curing protein
MRSLIANHAFVDGNKRAGLFAAVLFLRINGSGFDAPDDLVYDETVAVARRERSVEEIARFLSTYSKQFSPLLVA